MDLKLIEATPDGVVIVDSEGRLVGANAQATLIFGYSREELLALSVEALVPEAQRARHTDQRAQFARAPRSREMGKALCLSAQRKDGSLLPVEISLAPIQQEGRRLTVAVVRDVSERIRTLQELRASEAQYRRLFDGLPVAAFVHDEKQRMISANQAAFDQYGYTSEEFLALSVEQLLVQGAGQSDADQERLLWPDTKGALDHLGIWQHRKRSGELIDVALSSYAVELGEQTARLVIARDVTEKHRLEEQLRQAQKLEAIGRLAGGLAHDFNNSLTAILGLATMLHESLSDNEPARRDLGDICSAVERAAGLTQQLLAFSRKQVMQPQATDLNKLVTEVERMLRRLIGEHIDLRLHLAPALGTVLVDPTQLEQVIVNLVVNAGEAMPHTGKLTIETSNVSLDEHYARSHLEVAPGPYVLLAVTDTGLGMDEATRSRIFEPFFTTRQGKGTGLGLATVYGIVKQAGAHIWVYSEPAQGTTFKVYLPRHAACESPPLPRPSPSPLVGGHETILLVEDDELVRGTTLAILRSKSYEVLTARDGVDAVHLCANYTGPIHLLLSDVVMPGMSGRELADRLLAVRPNMRVLYMSGYTDNAIVHHGVLDPGIQFVQKPFSPAVLLRRLRAVLDHPGSAA